MSNKFEDYFHIIYNINIAAPYLDEHPYSSCSYHAILFKPIGFSWTANVHVKMGWNKKKNKKQRWGYMSGLLL